MLFAIARAADAAFEAWADAALEAEAAFAMLFERAALAAREAALLAALLALAARDAALAIVRLMVFPTLRPPDLDLRVLLRLVRLAIIILEHKKDTLDFS